MPARKRNTTIAATTILLIAVLASLHQLHQTGFLPTDGDVVLEPARIRPGTRSATARQQPDEKATARMFELERLKQRWVQVQDDVKRGIYTSEMRELARESSELLLCSVELLRLLEFLEGRGMRYAAERIREQIPALFASDLAPEARQLLAELSRRATIHMQGTLENWSYHAGYSCSKEELEDFLASLVDEGCALSASLAWNVQLAASDPVSAMTSTLQLLDSGAYSSLQHQILLRLVDRIPPEANWAEIELLLPPRNSETSTESIEEGRSRLLVKWAKLDPAAASNHVLEQPERVNPDTIRWIAHTVLERNYRVGLEWIENFPRGPYLDAAAQAAVDHASSRSGPELATRCALMIENDELREKCIEEIQNAQVGRHLPSEMEPDGHCPPEPELGEATCGAREVIGVTFE